MKFSFLASALGAAVFVMLAAAPHSAAQDCGDKLNNQTFCCQFKDAVGASSNAETFTFSNTENDIFSLATSTSGTYSCTCQVNGSVSSPKFDISKNFICSADPPGAAGLVGTATGTKIIKGQWIYSGVATIYSCTAGACP